MIIKVHLALIHYLMEIFQRRRKEGKEQEVQSQMIT